MAVTTFKNIRDNKSGTLLTAITASQTTLTLNTGQGASFPAAPFYISCDYEVMVCTAKVGDVFTVIRGVDNTIAAIHAAGSLVEMRSVAALWNDLAAAINAIESGTNPASQASTVANSSIVDASVAVGAAIALAKLARYPFANADLASDVARANLLVNPGFEIWQRGNGAFAGVAGQSIYGADRWFLSTGAGSSISMTRDAANADSGSQFDAAITYTHVATSFVTQKLEDFNQLRSRTITFSIRIKTSVANAVRLAINGSVLALTYGAYHTGGGTYQTLTVTATIPANETSIQANISCEASGTFYLDNAMLVIGSVPVDYQPLTPADELARCLRYYQRFGPGAAGIVHGVGQCTGTTTGVVLLPMLARMGGGPTLTLSAVGDFRLWGANSVGNVCTALSFLTADGSHALLNGTVVSGLVAGNATVLDTANVNAWLALEWNP